jgi:hypothetical protein
MTFVHQSAANANPNTRIEPIEVTNLYFKLRAVLQCMAEPVIAEIESGTQENSFVANKLLMSDHESATPSSKACFDLHNENLALRGERSAVSPDIHCEESLLLHSYPAHNPNFYAACSGMKWRV